MRETVKVTEAMTKKREARLGMARVYRTKHGYGIDYRFTLTRQGRI